MYSVASAAAVKEYEQRLMKDGTVPSLLLMERAALSVYESLCTRLDAMEQKEKRVLILSGTGNNGADGLALARFLTERKDVHTRVICTGNKEHATEEWRTQAGILERLGLRIEELPDKLPDWDIAVDAMLGIGLSRPLDERYQAVLEQLNAARREEGRMVIAIDIPTGLNSDSGRPQPVAVCADLTVSFTAFKRGMLLGEGRHYCGKVKICPIGAMEETLPQESLLHWEEVKKRLPERDILGHKGSFGKVLCISGSEGMPGAGILNARSVLYSGAGMVRIISPAANRELMIGSVPEAMFLAAEDCGEEELKKALDWADALVLGCGCGAAAASWLERRELMLWKGPVLIDADGLNALAKDKSFLKERAARGCPVVLTPHPGEFARLFPGTDMQDADALKALAAEYGCILVAKSATTVVSDGIKLYYNTEGNDGMATAGSGDVLAGIIGALLCVCESPLEAAAFGVSLHAHCGDEAAELHGKAAVTASALIDALEIRR
ncbi:MAG: NAD(P)H-hydrate dehydratase [Lachnospiraceae bacterium]|nr:NAD(P)H-hydrate dehydratase [Lachnospiraceae bacterium]